MEDNKQEEHPHLKHIPHFKNLTIIIGISIIIFAIISYLAYTKIKGDLFNVVTNQLKTTQFLLSNIDYKTERQKLVLFSRDKILEANKDISFDMAYTIASTNIKYCEMYHSIDPFLLLAIQRVESRFNPKAISPMGAMGVCQVMPVNARHLSKCFGICFSDTMLLENVDFNTRCAVQILDDALASYKSKDGAIAYYNGGTYSAYYYIMGNPKVPDETKQYVPNIKEWWKAYQEQYKTYQLNVDNLIKVDTKK